MFVDVMHSMVLTLTLFSGSLLVISPFPQLPKQFLKKPVDTERITAAIKRILDTTVRYRTLAEKQNADGSMSRFIELMNEQERFYTELLKSIKK